MKQFKVKLNEGEAARIAAQIAKGDKTIIIVNRELITKLSTELNAGNKIIFSCEHRTLTNISIKRLYKRIYFYKDYVTAYERGLNSEWSYFDWDALSKEDFFGYEKKDLAKLSEVNGFEDYENFYEYAACKCDLVTKSMSGNRLDNPYIPCSALLLCSNQSS